MPSSRLWDAQAWPAASSSSTPTRRGSDRGDARRRSSGLRTGPARARRRSTPDRGARRARRRPSRSRRGARRRGRGARSSALGGDGTLQDIAPCSRTRACRWASCPAAPATSWVACWACPGARRGGRGAGRGRAAYHRPGRRDAGARRRTRRAAGDPPGMTFVIGCGIGFDARLMATTAAGHKPLLGRYAYFVQADPAGGAHRGRALPGHRRRRDHRARGFDRDGHQRGRPGPGRAADALARVPDDGQLDLFVAGAATPSPACGASSITWCARTWRRRGAGTLRLRGRQVRLESTPPEPIQVDGDPSAPARSRRPSGRVRSGAGARRTVAARPTTTSRRRPRHPGVDSARYRGPPSARGLGPVPSGRDERHDTWESRA